MSGVPAAVGTEPACLALQFVRAGQGSTRTCSILCAQRDHRSVVNGFQERRAGRAHTLLTCSNAVLVPPACPAGPQMAHAVRLTGIRHALWRHRRPCTALLSKTLRGPYTAVSSPGSE